MRIGTADSLSRTRALASILIGWSTILTPALAPSSELLTIAKHGFGDVQGKGDFDVLTVDHFRCKCGLQMVGLRTGLVRPWCPLLGVLSVDHFTVQIWFAFGDLPHLV